jgi:hypothetical protein
MDSPIQPGHLILKTVVQKQMIDNKTASIKTENELR